MGITITHEAGYSYSHFVNHDYQNYGDKYKENWAIWYTNMTYPNRILEGYDSYCPLNFWVKGKNPIGRP